MCGPCLLTAENDNEAPDVPADASCPRRWFAYSENRWTMVFIAVFIIGLLATIPVAFHKVSENNPCSGADVQCKSTTRFTPDDDDAASQGLRACPFSESGNDIHLLTGSEPLQPGEWVYFCIPNDINCLRGPYLNASDFEVAGVEGYMRFGARPTQTEYSVPTSSYTTGWYIYLGVYNPSTSVAVDVNVHVAAGFAYDSGLSCFFASSPNETVLAWGFFVFWIPFLACLPCCAGILVRNRKRQEANERERRIRRLAETRQATIGLGPDGAQPPVVDSAVLPVFPPSVVVVEPPPSNDPYALIDRSSKS